MSIKIRNFKGVVEWFKTSFEYISYYLGEKSQIRERIKTNNIYELDEPEN